MVTYIVMFIILLIASIVMVYNEVEDDSASIKAGKGDNHADVWKYVAFSVIAGLGASMLFETAGGMMAVPIYLIVRFALFGRLLNAELGNPSGYLSNKGWDKLYKRIIPN